MYFRKHGCHALYYYLDYFFIFFFYFRYIFQFSSWIALDKLDGKTECLTNALDSCDSKVLFSDQIFYNLTENNLWISPFIRPNVSSFTRVQRLSCVVTFIFLAMLANAMFYQAPGTENEERLKIGIVSFSLTTLITSIKSVAVTAPPVVFLTLVFKHTRDKYKTEDAKDKERIIKPVWKRLPYWMRYVAWAVLVVTIASSSFTLILYSMQWGKTKSQEWLSSFLFSFVESATFVDPVKVVNSIFQFFYMLKVPDTLFFAGLVK